MNNLEEKIQAIEKELEQLKQELKKAQDTVGFGDDEIYLLSVEEYEKYKDIIPPFKESWWLQTPSTYMLYSSVFVNYDGLIDYEGNHITYLYNGVRPALKLSTEDTANLEVGDIIVKYKFPWVYLGEGLAIAETLITVSRFDAMSNDYKNSEIRQFLLNWLKERK